MCTRVLRFWGFEGYKCRERPRLGESSSYGDKRLANEVVRHFFNLTAKGCWESAKRVLRVKHALGGIIDFNSSYARDCIYKIGKARKHFFDELASRGSRWGSNWYLAWPLASELHQGWQENAWRPLSIDASRIQDKGEFGPCRGLDGEKLLENRLDLNKRRVIIHV